MKKPEIIGELVARLPELESSREDIEAIAQIWIDAFRRGNKLLLCGNGGSCADCEHIAGELMKGFLKRRPLPRELKEKLAAAGCSDMGEKLQLGLPCVHLSSHTALNTAFCNDVDPRYTMAQQLLALGKEGDVLLAISTSGNAENVYWAAQCARALGIQVTGLTGKDGGRLLPLCHRAFVAPSRETYRIQEYHLPVYHALCLAVEAEFFEE